MKILIIMAVPIQVKAVYNKILMWSFNTLIAAKNITVVLEIFEINQDQHRLYLCNFVKLMI